MSSVVVMSPGSLGNAAVRKAAGPKGTVSITKPTMDSVELLAAVDVDVDVVIFGSDVDLDTQLGVAGALDFHRPDVSVVLVCEPTAEMFSRALNVGIRDIVAPDASQAEYCTAIKRAAAAARRRRLHAAGSTVIEPTARVISVLSPKGGSGKTTVATNLAVGLARRFPGQVVLVDLDIQFGDVAGALRLEPQHSFADATKLGDRLDATTLKVFLTMHPTGLCVLCSPDSLIEADAISGDELKPVLAHLVESFEYVILDTAAGIGEYSLAALDVSTDFLLVCSTDVPSIRGIQRQMDAFDTVHLTKQRRTFVINRANARVGVTIADIEETIGMTVDVSIPSSWNIVVSTNQGEPIMAGDVRDQVHRSFEQLVDHFSPVGTYVGSGGNNRWFKKERA